jgi:hypothetical protein
MAHAGAPPPFKLTDDNPHVARSARSCGSAATAAAATGVGGGLPREELPRPKDYSTIAVGGGANGDNGAARTERVELAGVVVLLTRG